MSRAVKFRVWTGERFDYVGFVDGSGKSTFGEWRSVPTLNGEMVTDLQEYTGLKDKNGVDVYEGDVVSRGEGDTKVVFWWGNTASFDWNWVEFERDDYLDHFATFIEEYSVIGNINQNPELLK